MELEGKCLWVVADCYDERLRNGFSTFQQVVLVHVPLNCESSFSHEAFKTDWFTFELIKFWGKQGGRACKSHFHWCRLFRRLLSP